MELTGKKFGRLTVLKRVENDKYGCTRWLCECDCDEHNQVIVLGRNLQNKLTQSCGCLQKERISNALKESNKINKKKYNTYDLSGEYGIGYTFKNEEFYFDLEDYELIKDYCWHIRSDGYVATNDFNNNYKGLKLHRLLFPNAKVVDHINHIKHDCRKINLRECTSSKNNMNRGLHSNNTSGVAGVSWHKRIQKWCANIRINGKQTHLGSYENFEDAKKRRLQAEEKYYGEYSYKNSVNGGK